MTIRVEFEFDASKYLLEVMRRSVEAALLPFGIKWQKMEWSIQPSREISADK